MVELKVSQGVVLLGQEQCRPSDLEQSSVDGRHRFNNTLLLGGVGAGIVRELVSGRAVSRLFGADQKGDDRPPF